MRIAITKQDFIENKKRLLKIKIQKDKLYKSFLKKSVKHTLSIPLSINKLKKLGEKLMELFKLNKIFKSCMREICAYRFVRVLSLSSLIKR